MAGDTAFLNASRRRRRNQPGGRLLRHPQRRHLRRPGQQRTGRPGLRRPGVASLTNAPLAFTGTGSQTVSHLGVWDALTAGNFRFAVPLTGDLAFNAAGDLNLTAADVAAT